jgi:hypothetical protein
MHNKARNMDAWQDACICPAFWCFVVLIVTAK